MSRAERTEKAKNYLAPHKDSIRDEQPDFESVIFLDACSFYGMQPECIRVLNDISAAAQGTPREAALERLHPRRPLWRRDETATRDEIQHS